MKEYFRQPVVDTFDIRICLAKSVKHTVDFMTASEFDLHQLSIPLEFDILEAGTVHGLGKVIYNLFIQSYLSTVIYSIYNQDSLMSRFSLLV